MEKNINKEQLINLIDSGMTVLEISIELNVSYITIRRRLLKYNLKIKSREHKHIKIECLECGENFESLKKDNRKFCSKQCCVKNNEKIIKERRSEINEKISKKLTKSKEGICLFCKSKFQKKKKSQIYCSRSCQAKEISNRPEVKKRIGKLFSDLTKLRHENGDISIGWQTRKNRPPSYPEKVTIDYFNKRNIKFERELKIGKYFIDFAFIDKKIALEIDGRTHDDKEVLEKDERKTKFLELNGWDVYRIKWINDDRHFDRLNAFIVQLGEH